MKVYKNTLFCVVYRIERWPDGIQGHSMFLTRVKRISYSHTDGSNSPAHIHTGRHEKHAQHGIIDLYMCIQRHNICMPQVQDTVKVSKTVDMYKKQCLQIGKGKKEKKKNIRQSFLDECYHQAPNYSYKSKSMIIKLNSFPIPLLYTTPL